MELTRDNYYTPEADIEYMSCSQYQSFLKCEAAAMAKLRGQYAPSDSEALIVGNYFHTKMESNEAHAQFCEEHFEDIFKYRVDKKTGAIIVNGKYAAYENADRMINACFKDPLIQSLINMQGENEVIMTGELFGCKWRTRLDKYCARSRIIIDWKTCADIHKTEYNPILGERESFVEYLGYLMRAAVYTEIEKQYTGNTTDANFIIVAVSKQEPPDKAALLLNHRQRYDYELEQVQKNMSRILSVKTGRVRPKRCGYCEYCRSTKILKKIVPYYTLNPKFSEEREEEYDEAYDLENAQAQG